MFRLTNLARFPQNGLLWQEQHLVPKWPLPNLEDTTQRFLEYLRPLISAPEDPVKNFSASDYQVTQRRVAEFEKRLFAGPLLQRKLAQLDAEIPDGCWIEGFWKAGYEEVRDPLPLNINPGFTLSDDPLRPSAVARAASLICAGAHYSQLVRTNTLPPSRLNPKDPQSPPLCSSQIPASIGSSRIPLPGRDAFYVNGSNSRHVLVITPRGQFFALDVLAPSGAVASAESVEAALGEMLRRDAGVMRPQAHCGPMTAGGRDAWASMRRALLEGDAEFGTTLKRIDDALFVVCLEGDAPSSPEDYSAGLMARALHGEGSRNRWYDKNLQLIVSTNGATCLNMEHTGYDGNTLLRFTEHLWRHRDPASLREQQPAAAQAGAPQLLHWPRFSAAQLQAIDDAQHQHARVARGMQLAVHRTGFGKKQLVARKVSPDAFVQLAYQAAFFAMKGRLGSTYESLMMKHYRHGRTETLRPITEESARCVRALAQGKADAGMLREASEAHGRRAKACQQGQGVDRHLYALKMLACHELQRSPTFEMPSLYADKGYRTLCRSELSTSNCGGEGIAAFGFGPVEPDGLGLGYCIFDDAVNITATSWQDGAEPFVQHLEQAFEKLFQLIDQK